MKYYIIHDDRLVERRKNIEKQLERIGATDVEWVTTFPVEQVKILGKISPIPLGYISCSMKHYDALNRMIENNVPEAIIFEDDVIISDLFDTEKIPRLHPYVKLGRGLMEFYDNSKVYSMKNNTGTEAYFVNQNFARAFLSCIDLGWAVDIEHYSFLFFNYFLSIPCIPMCSQIFTTTSITESKSYFEENDWKTYIFNKHKTRKWSFKTLVDIIHNGEIPSSDVGSG